jgi:hypothetical protein
MTGADVVVGFFGSALTELKRFGIFTEFVTYIVLAGPGATLSLGSKSFRS